MTDSYREDLAYIHDAGFGRYVESAAAVLLAALRQRGLHGGRVIDLGCGSGILSERLDAAGFDILGIDISPAMVALARNRVPRGQFRVESLLSAELPSCVAVAAIGECFNFLFDRSNSKRVLSKLWRSIYRALAPGGLFLFDVSGPGRVPGKRPQRSYAEGKDWAVLFSAEEDRRRGLLTRTITSFRKVGELYRRDHEDHRLRLIGGSEMAENLRRAGFRVRRLTGYGPLLFPPGQVGFLARKPC